MTPTREQLLAQSADRQLAVTAGAGAGKTTVLVERFIHLLMDKRVDVRDITAITFTRKAASEMVSRVAAKVEKMLADEAQKADWERIKRIRERLTSANISTIHSFCARLLREYPIEAGVNPNFTELQEYEAALLKERAIVRTLEDWLEPEEQPQTQHTSHETDARQVWSIFGKHGLQEILTTILNSAETFEQLQTLYTAKTNAELLAERDKILLPELMRNVRTYLVTLNEALGKIDRAALKPTNKTTQHLNEADGTVFVLLHQLNDIRWETLEHVVQKIEDLKGKVCTKDGALKKTGLGDAVRDAVLFSRLNTALVEAYKALAGLETIIAHREYDAEMIDVARILVAIAADAHDYVQQEKNRLGALDFDDLQMKADKLLDNPAVCANLRRHLHYLMIDEFQDTNELQYRLARKVIGDWSLVIGQSDGERKAQRSNLFIVGDPKQSIYRFRGADVRVFARAKEDIQTTNRALLDAEQLSGTIQTPRGAVDAENDTQSAGSISLSATFRLSPVVAAFVNRVCGTIMSKRESEFDVEYEEIICGVASAAVVEGSVTMLMARGGGQGSSTKKQDSSDDESTNDEALTDGLSEAELLAQHIRHIIQKEPVLVRGKEGVRAAEYGDVYVLARSRTGFDDLTAAFRRAGVPFVVSGGRGFYERQEILDMRLFLLFLQNTGDDVACAAVLRSPFFTVTDAELYRISRSNGNGFWERACSYYAEHLESTGSQGCSQDFLRAYGILTALLPLAARLTIPTLLRTIIEQTGWRGMIAADERFEQIEANIEKLLGLAREFENKGFRNLYDFAEELRVLAEYSLKEGEADVTVGKNAVTMMTIHASKGLEAPIVVLYNSSADSPTGSKVYTDSRLGLAFEHQRLNEKGMYIGCPTPLFMLASRRDAAAEYAESKRLLYVALTRARDHIIVSGKIRENKGGAMGKVTGFLKMILEGMDCATENMLVTTGVPSKDLLKILENGSVAERMVAYTVPVKHAEQFSLDISSLSNNENRQQSSIIKYPLLLDSLRVSIDGDYYSASQLRLFERDPQEYECVYRLGLQPAADIHFQGLAATVEDDDDAVLGTNAGTLIHSVLQHLPLWLDVNGTINEDKFEAVLDHVLPQSRRILSDDLRKRVIAETHAVVRTALVRSIAGRFAKARFEYTLTMPISSDFLTGTLDVLVQNERNEYEIWDWKTNRVALAIDGEADMDRLLNEYRLQLEIYAYFLAKLKPEQDQFTARLLFTRRVYKAVHEHDWTRSVTFTREDINGIEYKIVRLITRIRAVSYGVNDEFVV